MKTIINIAALLAATAAIPAFAQDNAGQRSFSVHYADLDLTSDAGIRTLDRRIRNAASAACGIPSSADPDGKRAVKQCRADVRESAYAQLGTAFAAARRSGSTSLAAVR